MPLDMTGRLQTYLLLNTGRRYCPLASNLVFPTCRKLSSTSMLSSSEESKGVIHRRKTVMAILLPARLYCDLLSCHSDVLTLIIHSVSKPASVISEKMWCILLASITCCHASMGISVQMQGQSVQSNTEVVYGQILMVNVVYLQKGGF